MGFRMRKSFKVVPGVRLNVSKSGFGASVGGKGGRYSVHSSGRRTVSAGSGVIPGVYYQQSVGGGRSARAQAPAQVPAKIPKPGLFAPKGEKELYNAIFKARSVAAIRAVGDTHPDFRIASYSLAGFMLDDDDSAQAKSLLTLVFDQGVDPAVDPFVVKYIAGTRVKLPIAAGVSAELSLSRDAVGLSLAELLQEEGDLSGAIDVVERLEPSAYTGVSLAELYLLNDRPDEVIELTEGLTNEDDATAILLVFRGAAFRREGFHDAAHEALKEALRSRSRAAPIRHLALSERAANYLAQGKKAMARKDLERILAEDSDYEGVRERLAELAS